MAVYPLHFGPTQPALVDNGPVPTGQWLWAQDTGFFVVRGNFNVALTGSATLDPSNFECLVNGTPQTVLSAFTNVVGFFFLHVAEPDPPAYGPCWVRQHTIDGNLTRASDGYTVFPWPSREVIYDY